MTDGGSGILKFVIYFFRRPEIYILQFKQTLLENNDR